MEIRGVGPRRLRLALGILLFALGLAFALARLGPIEDIGTLRIGAPWVMSDFRHAVYYPSRAFWEGINPYNSSKYMERYPVETGVALYAPATFLLFLPFGLLPLALSSVLYFTLTIALTLVLAWAALRLTGFRPAVCGILAVAGILLLSRPGHWNLLSGQVTLIVVLATYATLTWARRAPLLAGAGLALALLKPSFGVPLVPLLLARGAGPTVAWGLAMAAAPNVFVLTVLVQREGGLAAFLTAVAQSHRVFAATPGNNPVQSVWRIDLAASLNRIVNQPLGLSIELLAAAVVLILAIMMMGRLNKSDTIDQKCVLEGLVCCTILLSLYHQAYDLLLLTLPAVAFARILYERRNPGRIGIAQSLLFSVLGLNYLATHSALEAFPLTANQRVVVVSVNGLALIGLFALYLVEAHQLSTPRS